MRTGCLKRHSEGSLPPEFTPAKAGAGTGSGPKNLFVNSDEILRFILLSEK